MRRGLKILHTVKKKVEAATKKVTAKAHIEALSPPLQEATPKTALNATIESLLALRSVRDQSADAGLDLSTDIAQKLTSLEEGLIDHLAEQREHQDGIGLLTVSVVGDFNSGKSTFINALLGMDVCPVGDEPTTASITHFVHGDQERIERKLEDGTYIPLDKSEYRTLAQHKKEGDSGPYAFRIAVNSPVLDHIRLVDTPGFNAPPPNTNDTKVTEEAVTESDVLFVLMDANKGNPSDTLLDQLDRLSQDSTNESRQPAFLLLNKAEGLPPSQRREVTRFCKERHGDLFRDVVPVSALQLIEAKDEEPLDALDIAMQHMRSAYKARVPFQKNISAELIVQDYRIDISGNVYDVPASSDFELASREQLAEMVKDVAAERHVLLEQQFQRNTLQLREDWQTTLSDLEQALESALSESSGGSDDGDVTKHKETVLEAIEEAKRNTINLVNEIFQGLSEEIVVKSNRTEEGFFSDTEYYQNHVYLDKAPDVVDNHDNWRRISGIYQGLLSYLKKSLDINLDFTPQEIAEYLKEEFLERIRGTVKAVEQVFQEDDESDKRGNFWQYEYYDEFGRNEHFNRMISHFESHGDDNLSVSIIQKVIDYLREAVISTAGRNQSQVAERAEELRRLQQRINEMKEHTL